MRIVMTRGAGEKEFVRLEQEVRTLGLTPHRIRDADRNILTVTGNVGSVHQDRWDRFRCFVGVAEVGAIASRYKLASRDAKQTDTVIEVRNRTLGGNRFALIGGPCAVESREQILRTAEGVKAAGGQFLRGGAVKPRTSPHSFQGLGEEGYRLLHEAGERFDLATVSEVVDAETVAMARDHVDIIQVGSRNMQNFSLLTMVGREAKPVLLKRGASATLEEFLLSAEYILAAGNDKVILCERGIRTFSSFQRNTLDVSIIPEIKMRSHLPVLADPSHAAGKRDVIHPLSRAALAAGADGIMVEMHDQPEQAKSDGPQSLHPEELVDLFGDMIRLAPWFDRTI